MNILAIGGSLKKISLNYILASAALKTFEPRHATQYFHMREFPLTLINEDEEKPSLPANVVKISDMIVWADGIVLACPEYNGTIPATVKNLIDWTSRVRPQQPWKNKHVLLVGASPGSLGTLRALTHVRIPLSELGAFVFPGVFGLPKAHEAFDSNGNLKDISIQDRLSALCSDFEVFCDKALRAKK